jgi:hypothetical protein
MKRLARVTEPEVIADFLRGEFYHHEYDQDRHRFETLVHDPRLNDDVENGLRRALLFRRRATMWRELPQDTQWWEVELEPADVERINIFPRAQWRSLARGNYQGLHVAELVRSKLEPGKPNDLAAKIRALCSLMRRDTQRSTILLIALHETSPSTVLEGNHRFVASLLLPRDTMLRRLRVVCGFSPYMERCCWYKTSVPNLFRYLKNRIKHLGDREADTGQWLQQMPRTQTVDDYARSASLPTVKTE